ncbi:hypothetical protein HG535_0B01460 [Zygotorulaspora mrakii]|uniref:Uncharacterized protein n=1 Tax=Zygotorulaspora mrakii TaxID=42260 RepID=A0A7H9AXG4_ZYGMR|nr:uncharacterized protein HG535_0B01460 [Zygotorulaspora mrakii]QLG71108.1 hypothetical protein HG535_0B01460 [Zygotorulaspora mrakii]
MALPELSFEVLGQLSKEYLDHAHRVAGDIKDEDQLKDYFKLVSMSVQCLQYLKTNYPLSIAQDAEITYQLVEVLLEETLNFDLAEAYLSSIRERLQNHHGSYSNWSVLHEKMKFEFLTLYVLPMKRDDKFHYRIALKNCDEVVHFLAEWKYDKNVTGSWLLIFQYVNIRLNIKLNNVKRALSQFQEMTVVGKGSTEWKSFIILCHVNFYLNQRLIIPSYLLKALGSLSCDQVGAKLYGWKLMLELIIQIYKDSDITGNLNEFKEFFAEQKDALKDDQDSVTLEIGPSVHMHIQLSSVFQYKHLKNVLLLLQSVSYLVNCYAKRANFSTKFLPKVSLTTKKLISSVTQSGPHSLSFYDSRIEWYRTIQQFSEFYQKWEGLLLTGQIKDTRGNTFLTQDYAALLSVISHQIGSMKDGSQICDSYNEIISRNRTSNEVRMVALLNAYIIRVSLMSGSVQKQEQLIHCNSLWLQITNTLEQTDLHLNPTWDCTVVVIWLISHFESFTAYPLPVSDDERSSYIERFKVYYEKNKFEGNEVDNDLNDSGVKKLKKSLLMQILLNYVGGRLFEQDLTVISQISGICFRLARQQKFLILEYVVGLWHLMNCTVAMKRKEVVLVTATLDSIVKKLSAGEQSSEPAS